MCHDETTSAMTAQESSRYDGILQAKQAELEDLFRDREALAVQ
jgi:hypothetical protein